MKKPSRQFWSSIIFLTLLICLIAGISRIVEYKGSREKIKPFFERAEQIDVLFFGDSHAYSGIYPMELYHFHHILLI